MSKVKSMVIQLMTIEGHALYLNASAVVCFHQHSEKTAMVYANGGQFEVREEAHMIANLIHDVLSTVG